MPDRPSEFAQLYDRHAADVYRFALRLCGDPHEAEEITAEAFARAFTASAPIRATTVRAYLLTIARHFFLETRRRAARDVHLTDEIPDAHPEPFDQAEMVMRLEAIGDALARLPEGERTALVMRVFHQMPYEEIARSLSISVAAAKVRVHRARLALSELPWRPR